MKFFFDELHPTSNSTLWSDLHCKIVASDNVEWPRERHSSIFVVQSKLWEGNCCFEVDIFVFVYDFDPLILRSFKFQLVNLFLVQLSDDILFVSQFLIYTSPNILDVSILQSNFNSSLYPRWSEQFHILNTCRGLSCMKTENSIKRARFLMNVHYIFILKFNHK